MPRDLKKSDRRKSTLPEPENIAHFLTSRHYLKMLPRHLQSLALRSSARNRALVLRQTAFATTSPISAQRTVGFHSSSSRQNELPKSPFQTFVEVLRDELRKNRELQDNVKQLQGDVDKFQDSEAMKTARAAYERARVRIKDVITSVYAHKCDDVVDLKYQRKSTSTSRCGRVEEDRC